MFANPSTHTYLYKSMSSFSICWQQYVFKKSWDVATVTEN